MPRPRRKVFSTLETQDQAQVIRFSRDVSTIFPLGSDRAAASLAKQLAGQYTIYYTSNLPSDGSEHRVQLKFGAMTGAKSFVPPARTAVAPPATKTVEPPADLPDWLPLYPGAKPEGISVITEPETGKRVGSYFFGTPDEIEQVHDFYDKMTKVTWNVNRAPTQVWGSSKAEGRKFEVSPERRGDKVRVRVTFEESKKSAPAPAADAGTTASASARSARSGGFQIRSVSSDARNIVLQDGLG